MLTATDTRRKSKRSFRLFLLFLLLLLLFFLFHSLTFLSFIHRNYQPPTTSTTAPLPTHSHAASSLPTQKPWPSLPSLLPWTGHRTRTDSCEGYFGNGYTEEVELLRREGKGLGFRCFYSETLWSSVCEGGRIRMDPRKIVMSEGGEDLEKVIGRGEEEELPKFQIGAFQIEQGDGEKTVTGRKRLVDAQFLDRYLPIGAIGHHTMRELLRSVEIVGHGQLHCDQWIDNPTLLVTRFEYANVFHTTTDWFSAYASSRVTNLPKRPDLVFVDGHCKTQLEETWNALFSSLRYAKNFTNSICFRHAILPPLGYETAMFKALSESISCHGSLAATLQQTPDDRKTARISEFGEMIKAVFGLTVDEHKVIKGVSGHDVLFVRREDYLAHPRHDGKVQSRLSNEEEIYDSLKKWSSTYTKCKISIINGLFAHMPMKDQLMAFQDASVVIGAHGAGLTHLVTATKNTKVIEIISSQYNRPHFKLISEWKGLEYHPIHLDGSYAPPSLVIKELTNILRSLGC